MFEWNWIVSTRLEQTNGFSRSGLRFWPKEDDGKPCLDRCGRKSWAKLRVGSGQTHCMQRTVNRQCLCYCGGGSTYLAALLRPAEFSYNVGWGCSEESKMKLAEVVCDLDMSASNRPSQTTCEYSNGVFEDSWDFDQSWFSGKSACKLARRQVADGKMQRAGPNDQYPSGVFGIGKVPQAKPGGSKSEFRQ